jgi:FtsP/CotA-like multicopper oxidase with cupredoxin domain
MMPASRVSVRVLNGEPRMRHAVWRTNVYNTNGDQWPAIDLASIELAAPMAGPAPPLKIPGGAKKVVSPVGVLGAPARLAMPGADRPLSLDEARAQPSVKEMMSASPGLQPKYPIDPALRLGLRQDPACANLQPGEHRRIYFGTPDNHNNDPNRNFGIATSVIGADGREKNLTDMLPFDVSNDPICLTASGDKDNPTTEFWEIYNLTNEDHNFHVHQTRFAVVPAAVAQAGKIPDGAVLQDNTPLVRASDDMKTCTGNLADFKTCNPDPVWVGIPFTEIGDFVFHCHILEHEDGGMMANIRVVPPPLAAKQ